MAEAYLNSLKIENVHVSSSGIAANQNENGPIAWDTIEILKEHNILAYTPPHWTQSTKEVIEKNDVVVCMEKIHHDYCVHELQVTRPTYETWNIADTDINKKREEVIVEAKMVFQKIVECVNELATRIQNAG